jgi:hypothetical protein
MTFKHITFGESPIMRSLEKVARERGMFEDEPVVKEASAGETYEPTDDLLSDMLRLATGLRERGFVAEANTLEDKIFVHKKAAKAVKEKAKDEGEKMLDDAHPEGDVEVAPSQSGYGKMLTQKTTQDEIKKIVNKMPTGKYAHKKFAQSVGGEIDRAIAALEAVFDQHDMDANEGGAMFGISWQKNLARMIKDAAAGKDATTLGKAVDAFVAAAPSEMGDYINRRRAELQDSDGDLSSDVMAEIGGIWHQAQQTAAKGGVCEEGSTCASAVESIVKAAEEALDIKTAADMPSPKDVYEHLFTVFMEILNTDVDNVIWRGDDEWKAFNEDEAKHIAQRAKGEVHDYLEEAAEKGYNARNLLYMIRGVYSKYHSHSMGAKVWHDWPDNDWMDAGVLWDKMKAPGVPPLLIEKTPKYIADQKAAKAPKKQPTDVTKITKPQLQMAAINPLNGLAIDLEEFADNKKKTDDSRAKAASTAKKYRYMAAALDALKAPMAYQAVKDAFLNMNPVLAPTLGRFQKLNSLHALKVYIEKKEAGVSRFINSPKYKKASAKSDLSKLAQMEDEPAGEPKDDAPPAKPMGKGTGNVVLKMQTALKSLSDEFTKSNPARATALAQGGLDSDWKGLTSAALKEADKVRFEVDKTLTQLNPAPSGPNAMSNTKTLDALLAKVKSGEGLGYKGTGQSLGQYKRPSGKGSVEITTGDTSSLASFQRFLEDTNIVLELGGQPVAPTGSKAEQEAKPESPEKKKREAFPSPPKDRGFADDGLASIAKSVKGPDGRFYQTELFDKPEDKTPKSDEMIPGLTLAQWRKAFSHFKQEAYSAYKAPETKNRRNSQTLFWEMKKLEKWINDLAVKQKTAPDQVVNTGTGGPDGEGVAYPAKPGKRIIYDRYGKPYYWWENKPIPEGFSHSLGQGAGGAGLKPPVSHVLDLRDPRFGMPLRAFKRRLTYNSFINMQGPDIVAMFAHTQPKSDKEVQARYAISRGWEPVYWNDNPKVMSWRVKLPNGSEKLMMELKRPGYDAFAKTLKSSPQRKAMTFLRLALSRLAREYNKWEQGVPDAEADRIGSRVEKDYNKWTWLLNEQYGNVAGAE